MYRISKEFHFSASHRLMGLPDTHPCSRPHGHNYTVTFHFKSSTLNDVGFVIDYRELEPIKKYLDERLDHQDLNVVLPVSNPTAENIARFLYDRFAGDYPRLYRVEVSETPKTQANYERD
ncbi:MAG: 6-carboxytetrahydropterin synthase [Bacteroidales bacterium]|jgi:6-pyruvoyltetrahydropterin/6-carboxytetrahydropterin synthase|nr:6-carboxytetrahydropterin synthase [Bacteroidales bacterium]